MPRGDRTGPTGEGSMTGRGQGNCSGNNGAGFNNRGFGRGNGFNNGGNHRGRGVGNGRGFGNGNFQESNSEDISLEVSKLREQITGLEEQISKLAK